MWTCLYLIHIKVNIIRQDEHVKWTLILFSKKFFNILSSLDETSWMYLNVWPYLRIHTSCIISFYAEMLLLYWLFKSFEVSFSEKKSCVFILSFKIYTVKTAITVWAGIFRVSISCIFTGVFFRNNVILSYWRAC